MSCSSGRDKGRRGAVIQVLADGRVVVESVNMVKKHQKPNPQGGKQGGIIEKEMPLARLESRDLESRRQERRPRRDQDARRTASSVRFFKSNGEMLDA